MSDTEEFRKTFHDLKNRAVELKTGLDILKQMMNEGEDSKELVAQMDTSINELQDIWKNFKNNL